METFLFLGMNIVLFDHPVIRQNLLPFTFTRPVAEIRIGILTIREKWGKRCKDQLSYLTEDYLTVKYPIGPGNELWFINGAVCPTDDLVKIIQELDQQTLLTKNGMPIAWRGPAINYGELEQENYKRGREVQEYEHDLFILQQLWEIFVHNGEQLRIDYDLITQGRKSAKIDDPYTAVYHKENIFIEEGAIIKSAILNAENGPIYIGKNVEIGEGSIIRGAFAIGDNSILNLGSKMRGDNTIGPYCKIGGEVSNSVIFGHSSKAHDGFIGNSVIGEWCNMGADSNTSNLKNNYGEVRLWNYHNEDFMPTGRQFCGLMLGDHSKCGINTMFNTGTVVGVGANIYGSDFPINFIPSYSWGGAHGFTIYHLDKFLEVVPRVFERRGKILDDIEKDILKEIFNKTAKYRLWEKF